MIQTGISWHKNLPNLTEKAVFGISLRLGRDYCAVSR